MVFQLGKKFPRASSLKTSQGSACEGFGTVAEDEAGDSLKYQPSEVGGIILCSLGNSTGIGEITSIAGRLQRIVINSDLPPKNLFKLNLLYQVKKA